MVKGRKMVSPVWQYCTRISRTTVQCNICDRIMVYHGTTNIKVHVERHFRLVPKKSHNTNEKQKIKETDELPANSNNSIALQEQHSMRLKPEITLSSALSIKNSPVRICRSSYDGSMKSLFSDLLGENQFVDVTLACDEQEIKCHKVILSACSNYFRKLLSQTPCQHPVIFLKGIEFSELKSLVNFMYKGEVNVAKDRLVAFHEAANSLHIKGFDGDNVSFTAKSSFIDVESGNGSTVDSPFSLEDICEQQFSADSSNSSFDQARSSECDMA
uniref:BTB domain-containing protein n=1 Tax=Clastoptera arizonana TaxID=38151 RepID=A0A1B6CIZ7_9HEMI